MAPSNLRSLSTLLIGAERGNGESNRDAKQREWIWGFILKNCTDGRVIQGLLKALPFPNDNLNLKRMLFLRSMSIQVSTGIIDELTLDILRALGQLGNIFEGSDGKARCPVVPELFSAQLEKKRELPEEEDPTKNVSQVKESVLPKDPVGSEELEQSKDASAGAGPTDVKRAEPVMGIAEWLNKIVLPKGLRGRGGFEQNREEREGKETCNANKAGVSGLHDSGNKFVSKPGQFLLWEVQLVVMVELAVQHLRGDPPNWKSFKRALTKYWHSDIHDSFEHVVDGQEMTKKRVEIKRELQMVECKPELLGEIIEKYGKERVDHMLVNFLEEALAQTGQTFLERVGTDVVNGTYNPVISRAKKTKKAGVPQEDLDIRRGRENGKELTSRKPCVRVTRGSLSRSREKLQRGFGISETDPETRNDGEDAGIATELLNGVDVEKNRKESETRTDQSVLGLSNYQDRVEKDGEKVNARNTSRVDGPTGSGASDIIVYPLRERAATPGSNEREIKQANDTHSKDAEPGFANEAEDKNNRISPSSPRSPDQNENQVSFSPPPWGSSPVQATEETRPSLIRKRKSGRPRKDTQAGIQIDEPRSPGSAAAASQHDKPSDSRRTLRNLQKKQKVLDEAVQDPLPNILLTSRVQCNFTERTSRVQCNLMEWNGTAQTQEDDIEESPSSPSASRRVRLPPPITGHRVSPLLRRKTTTNHSNATNGKQFRRRARRWSQHEVDTLKSQVGKYGKGRWKLILEKNEEIFEGRTEVDLKDKWRNLERFEGISDKTP